MLSRFAIAAGFAAATLATPVIAATYQLTPISFACTLDCTNERAIGRQEGEVVTLSGTVTTDIDSGVISVSNIVDWSFTIDGPENPATTYSLSDDGQTVPNTEGPLPVIFDNTAPFTAGGNVQIFADGTNFSITIGSNGPNSTSIFRYLVNATIDFGVVTVPTTPLAQLAFILSTDSAGTSDLDRSLGYTVFPAPGSQGTPDSGAETIAGSTFQVLTGSVVAPQPAAVPLPAGAVLIVSALGALGTHRRRMRA